VVGIGLGSLRACDLSRSLDAREREVKTATAQEAARAAGEIDANLRQGRVAVAALASDLASGQVTESSLVDRMEALLAADAEILGVGVAFAPNRGRLNAPYLKRTDDGVDYLQLAERLDYTAPQFAWYREALANGPGWRDPAWDEVEESMTAVYSAPFERAGEPAGVAFASISLERVQERVHALDTGRSGWSVILSSAGTFLVHPDEQWIEDRVNVLDLVPAESPSRAPIETALRGETVSFEQIDRNTAHNAWYFLEPVVETGWVLGLIRIEDEVLTIGRSYRRGVIQAALAGILGLLSLGFALIASRHPMQRTPLLLWGLVIYASVLFIAGIDVVRRVTYDHVSDEERDTVRVFDESGLNSFVRAQKTLWKARLETPPLAVPTGILVRSLTFSAPKEVFATGVVWQKFADDELASLFSGIELPDAVNADLVEVYRRHHGDNLTIGWRFKATLRQVMDVTRYPLDHDNAAIRLLPRGYDSRVILVPDLTSYTMLTPSARPGLEEALELSGWTITGSFFDYKYASYNTDFGIPDFEGETSIPELHFNVELKRNLMDAAIANGIPLIVVLVLLYAIILTRTTDTDESKLFGFNPSGVMRICSALFFVVILAHIQLRNTVQAQEVVFLEYLYFIVYLALLLTALHTFLFFSSKVESRFVEHRDSLMAKVLYWPVILGLQLAIAVALFY
jgi:hypothetical protein